MRQRSRIRVVIRRIDGVRGVCVGFLMAFDKHMNMVCVDAGGADCCGQGVCSVIADVCCGCACVQVLQDVDEEFVDVHA